MSSKVKIKSPYLQENRGDSILVTHEFNHEKSIREISLENTGTASVTVTPATASVSGTISLGPHPFTGSIVMPPTTVAVEPVMNFFVRNTGNETSLTLSMTASDGDIYTEVNGVTGMSVRPITFLKNSFEEKTSRNIDYVFNVDENGDYVVKSYENPLLESKTSFGLLRTNPLLTGNVKLTVDSTEKIWLNSIDALKELADSRFKKFPLNSGSNYVIDIHRFWDKGSTPPEIVYSLFQQAGTYFSTQRTYTSQFDRFYTYGAEQLNSKFYDEDFTFFAPLRIGEILPEYFVIFRANGSLNEFTYTEAFADWKNSVNAEILKKADIVKVFDLSEKSRVGKYIRNLKNHPARKESEMSVSFQRDGYTTFNGISYPEASFAQKGELLADFFAQPNSILNTEEFLTLGMQRNKLISGSILNLEFLFDDEEAENYTVNRYFGLYLRENEIASFFLSDKALEQYSLEVGQTPLPRKGVDGNKLSSRSFTQTNDEGIKLYVNTSSVERTNTSAEVFTTLVSAIETGPTAVYFTGDWVNNPHFATGDQLRFGTAGFSSATATVSAITQETKRAKITISGYTSSGYLPFSLLAGSKVDFFTEEKQEERNLSTFDNDLVQSSLRLFYLKDKKGNFYNVNSTREVQTKLNSFDYATDVEISLNEKKVDVSNFTGVNEILTQTEAEIMLEQGNSVMEFEVKKIFREFDFIEIAMGATNSLEPTRWRIKAQTPNLLPGEVWPDYSIVTDVDGSKYYLALFYPGVENNLEQLAETIVKAFNVFPYKIFETVSDGTKVYMKSRIAGVSSNGMKIIFAANEGTVSVYDHENPEGLSSVNFMGGSTKTKNRARVPREIAEGILDIEYFKTVGSYSKLKNFDVFGNNVRYFSYLEKPLYDEVDKIYDFDGKEDYALIELENDTKFDLTQDKKTTSYSIHMSKFGVFSFFPLKDFDTDCLVSDYGRNYDVELLEFFQNIGAKTYEIVPTSNPVEYKVAFSEAIGLSGNYSFIGVFSDGRKPKNYNGFASLSFSGATSSVADLQFYRGPSGDWDINAAEIALSGGDAPSRLVILPDLKALYYEENSLAKFRGFFSLSSVITEEDLRTFSFLESQWDFERFFFTRISTEYDRLQENFLKEQALKSKVVPYVMKWVSPDGKDVRDNPYRFNYSRAFGTMNFSPSIDYPEADSRNHTHEWPYLANVPYFVDPIKYANFSFSYLFDKPDLDFYDFYSVKKDWFSEYFVTGYPTELYKVDGEWQKVPAEAKEKYSIFKFDAVAQKTYTIFRGIRLEIGEQLSQDGAVLQGSERYHDYKFSSVIVPVQEEDFDYHDQVEFDIIINDKFKFIVNVIKVKISSYKNPEGNFSYVDLYTLENKRDKCTYLTDSSKVSPAGSTFTFSKGVPSDVLFPAPIFFKSAGPIVNNSVEKSIAFNLYLNEKGSTKDFVLPLSNGSYSYPYGFTLIGGREKTTIFQNIIGVYDKGIKLPFDFPPVPGSYYSRLDTVLGRVFSAITVPTTIEPWDKYKFFYASGGDSSNARVRDMLSFYEISNVLQKKSTKLEENIYHVSSTGTIATTTKLLFNVVTPEKFLREQELFPLADEDKPSELFSYEMIGMVLAQQYSPQYIYRYQGNFVPKFKDIFLFGAREEEDFAFQFNNDYKLGNTFIADVLEDTFYLRNQYYSKVADEEILRINQSSGYKSLYPLVNEISIDHRDLFAWSSSWDKNYYRKYSTVSQYVDKNGTEEMKEIKSFLGSKMMKLPKEYSLFEFIVNGDSPELVATEDGLNVTLEIDVYDKFLRELIGTTADTRAKTEFLRIASAVPEAIAVADVETKTLDYLRKNIVDLFKIEKVNFYLLESGNTGTLPGEEARPLIEFNESGDVQTTLTEKEFIRKKYDHRKDVKTTLSPELKLKIEFTLDSRFYTSMGIGVDISRI